MAPNLKGYFVSFYIPETDAHIKWHVITDQNVMDIGIRNKILEETANKVKKELGVDRVEFKEGLDEPITIITRENE